jgi:hypothetical protein
VAKRKVCTHSGSMSEVRKSLAGSSAGKGSGWSASVRREASGWTERLVSDFFLEGARAGTVR